jgi:hypothetical protein
MPIRIKLSGQDETLRVDVDRGEWNKAFSRALKNDEMLEIHDAGGRVLAINPHQVLYLEEVPENGVRDGADSLQAADPTPAAAG